MVGQKFVINVDQSVQVSTALLSGCGAAALLLPPPEEALSRTYLCLFFLHGAVTQVCEFFFTLFFWVEGGDGFVIFFVCFYTMFTTHGLSRHLEDQHEQRVFSAIMSPLFQNYELFWHINYQQWDTFAVINMATIGIHPCFRWDVMLVYRPTLTQFWQFCPLSICKPKKISLSDKGSWQSNNLH